MGMIQEKFRCNPMTERLLTAAAVAASNEDCFAGAEEHLVTVAGVHTVGLRSVAHVAEQAEVEVDVVAEAWVSYVVGEEHYGYYVEYKPTYQCWDKGKVHHQAQMRELKLLAELK